MREADNTGGRQCEWATVMREADNTGGQQCMLTTVMLLNRQILEILVMIT